jgi:protein O-GlcNAc transferase
MMDARQAPAAFHLGAALWLIEPGERALSFFKLAIEGRPRDFEYRSRYGQALDQIGRCADAAVEFHVASELRPADADNWRRLGSALQRSGNRSAALQAYARSLRLDPADQDTRDQLGAMMLEIGQTDPALAAGSSIRLMLLRKGIAGTAEVDSRLRTTAELDPSVMEARYIVTQGGR